MANAPTPPGGSDPPEPGKRSGEGAASVLEFLRNSLKTKPALSVPPQGSPTWDAPTEPVGLDPLGPTPPPGFPPRTKR